MESKHSRRGSRGGCTIAFTTTCTRRSGCGAGISGHTELFGGSRRDIVGTARVAARDGEPAAGRRVRRSGREDRGLLAVTGVAAVVVEERVGPAEIAREAARDAVGDVRQTVEPRRDVALRELEAQVVAERDAVVQVHVVVVSAVLELHLGDEVVELPPALGRVAHQHTLAVHSALCTARLARKHACRVTVHKAEAPLCSSANRAV